MPDDILAILTYDTALALVGRTYRAHLDARSVDLTVSRVIRAADNRPRPKELHRDAFSIFFRGPSDILLPQRMYDLTRDGESFPNLFIVPVGKTPRATSTRRSSPEIAIGTDRQCAAQTG